MTYFQSLLINLMFKSFSIYLHIDLCITCLLHSTFVSLNPTHNVAFSKGYRVLKIMDMEVNFA